MSPIEKRLRVVISTMGDNTIMMLKEGLITLKDLGLPSEHKALLDQLIKQEIELRNV